MSEKQVRPTNGTNFEEYGRYELAEKVLVTSDEARAGAAKIHDRLKAGDQVSEEDIAEVRRYAKGLVDELSTLEQLVAEE